MKASPPSSSSSPSPSPSPSPLLLPLPLLLPPPIHGRPSMDQSSSSRKLLVGRFRSKKRPTRNKGKVRSSSGGGGVKRTSPYRGVTKHRWTGKYEAHLWDRDDYNPLKNRKGKQVYLGAFEDEESAAHAYDLASLKFWGPSGSILNFPSHTYLEDYEEMQAMTREEYLAVLRRGSSGFSKYPLRFASSLLVPPETPPALSSGGGGSAFGAPEDIAQLRLVPKVEVQSPVELADIGYLEGDQSWATCMEAAASFVDLDEPSHLGWLLCNKGFVDEVEEWFEKSTPQMTDEKEEVNDLEQPIKREEFEGPSASPSESGS